MTRTTYTNMDTRPEEAAYASYAGWEQPGTSRRYHPPTAEHSDWSQPTPEASRGTWPEATNAEWKLAHPHYHPSTEQYTWSGQEVNSGGHPSSQGG